MYDDEEVDKEIDVYLSKGLVDKLYLFQYPTRPWNMTYDDAVTLATRVKPQQQKVELEFSLDTQSCYDHSKGEQIALNVDGRRRTDASYFDSSYMDKIMLSSVKAVSSSSTSRYAVGLLKQGELHITPLHSILQMQPSFSYLDRSDTQAKLENQDTADEDDAEEATAVTVRFARTSADQAKLAKERSYNYMQQQSASEPWIDVAYHRYKSHRSNVEHAMLICSQMDRDASNMSVTPLEYLKVLVPETLVSSGIKPVKQTLQSIKSVKALPPNDQMKAFISSAKVLRFRELSKLLPPGIDSTNLERALQQIAVLVQGCWVVKSEILYPKNSTSRLTGIAGDILASVRDYILWCYTKSRCLTRSEILVVVKVPNDDVTDILSQVARRIQNRGWEFKYSFDKEFVEDHPGVVQRQQMLWDARYKQLVKELKLGQMDSKNAELERMAVPSPQKPRHRRQLKYLRDSVSDDTEESASESSSVERMDVDSVPKRRNYKASKRTASSQRGEHVSAKNGPRSRLGSYIATLEVSPTFVNEISPESKASLLKLMKERLKKHYCMTFNDIKERLSDSSPSISGLSDTLLEKLLSEAGALRVRNKWPQNTSPEPLYAFTKFGDKFDRYREALLDLFSNTARSRPNLLVKKFEDEFGEVVSDADCRQIFEEYCIYKSGYYYLKGTIHCDS